MDDKRFAELKDNFHMMARHLRSEKVAGLRISELPEPAVKPSARRPMSARAISPGPKGSICARFRAGRSGAAGHRCGNRLCSNGPLGDGRRNWSKNQDTTLTACTSPQQPTDIRYEQPRCFAKVSSTLCTAVIVTAGRREPQWRPNWADRISWASKAVAQFERVALKERVENIKT